MAEELIGIIGGTGMLDARRRRTEDGRQKTEGG
ncbi:hypothetical protein ES703_16592 [subsurface metagenome]